MSKSKLIQRLEQLTPEEQALVSKLLGVVEEAAETAPVEPKKNSKRKQRRKTEKEPEVTDVKPRKKVEIPQDEYYLDDEPDEPKVDKSSLPGRARRVKTRAQAQRNVRNTQQVKGRRNKGAPARSEPVDLSGGRPNRFEKMAAFNAEKGDSRIDALLNKGRRPSERREAVEFVEVECTRCGDIWEVPPTFVYNDDEGSNFICDSCRGRGAK